MKQKIDAAQYFSACVCACVCVPDWGSSALGGFQQDGDGGVGLIERRLLVVRRHQGGCGEEGGGALTPAHTFKCVLCDRTQPRRCRLLRWRDSTWNLCESKRANSISCPVCSHSPEILVVNWVMTGGPKPFTVDALIVKE